MKKLSAFKILTIARALDELSWMGPKVMDTKKLNKIRKQLRKMLRKGA